MKMNHRTLKGITVLLCAILIVISCRHVLPFPIDTGTTGGNGSGTGGGGNTSSDTCDQSKIYFQQQVLPLLVSNCAQSGCHDNATHREGIIIVSYASVMQTAGVKAGNASGSKLYKVISSGSMPPNGYAAMTAAQKNLVYQWIQQGALDLVCNNLCDSSHFTFSGTIQPLISTKCQGCHNSTNPLGGVDLSSYAAVKTQADNGKLSGSVNWAAGLVPMPQNGSKLSDCELAQIQNWIAAGAPNN